MKLPVIEFKFKYNGVNTKMMVALEDILFIDEYHLHLRDDARSFELVDGEYENLQKTLEVMSHE